MKPLRIVLKHAKFCGSGPADLMFAKYQNNDRVAICLLRDGHPLCTASVNVPDYPLLLDCVIIKDYSENEGILQDLIDNNIVSQPVDTTPVGHAWVHICKLLVDPANPANPTTETTNEEEE